MPKLLGSRKSTEIQYLGKKRATFNEMKTGPGISRKGWGVWDRSRFVGLFGGSAGRDFVARKASLFFSLNPLFCLVPVSSLGGTEYHFLGDVPRSSSPRSPTLRSYLADSKSDLSNDPISISYAIFRVWVIE